MTEWSPGLLRAPPRAHLVQWCDATLPGWRPTAVRRLCGGLDTAMHAAVRAALLGLRPQVRWPRPVLTHGDFHPGNVLWRRGRILAVVDWDAAAVGDPGVDVGFCHAVLAIQHSQDAAEDFLGAYQTRAGWSVPHLVFWDLLAAALAIRFLPHWVTSMHAFGQRAVTLADLRQWLGHFIATALARC